MYHKHNPLLQLSYMIAFFEINIFSWVLQWWDYSKAPFLCDEKLFELFSIKNDFPKYFAKCCNLLYFLIFCVTHYNNSSKWYTFTPQDKSNLLKVHVLHNFTKYFSGAIIYEIVSNSLVAVCCLRVCKNWFLLKFCSTEKWVKQDISDKNFFSNYDTV